MEIRPDPNNPPTYRQEFKESVDIFDKSFHNAIDTDFNPQKEQYYKAMHTALQAMGDAANGLVNQQLIEMKKQLAKDTEDYIHTPNTEKQKRIEEDLRQLRREVD